MQQYLLQAKECQVHDNEQIFYPGMLARSTHNEKGTFLLNGNNCVIVAIFHKEEEADFVSIQGFRVRYLKKCPESVAVCNPAEWRDVARRLQGKHDYGMEMAKLIRDGKVLLVKAQAIDKKELEKDSSKVIWTVLQGNSTKDLPNNYIAITPACVGTIHKLQGATIRGRVVVDLSHLSSTQAIYTAVTRVTSSELLKLATKASSQNT